MIPVDYSSTKTPADYKCATCNAKGCKMWRDYGSFDPNPKLECVDCACKSQKKVNNVNGQGERTLENEKTLTDQIGWRVPAVPTLDNLAYWGYGHVPDDGVAWWVRLPLRSKS